MGTTANQPSSAHTEYPAASQTDLGFQNKVLCLDPHLNKYTAQNLAQKYKSFLLSLPSLFSSFSFFHRCQKRFHGLCVCVNLPHPFWVLIYPFRFNLPVSGFPRPLIRLWGVDTNTKHTHLDFETRTHDYFLPPNTHIWMYTHPLKCCRNTVPDLRHALLRQSSSALCGPLSLSGSPQLHQSPRQDRRREGE